MYQCFEQELLCIFIMMQSAVDLSQVEIIRPKYNSVEKALLQCFKIRLVLVALLQLFVILLIFVPGLIDDFN